MNALDRYHQALQSIPAPGTGCHPALLGAANSGVMAEVPPERIHQDLRAAIPVGFRHVSDREISDAVKKAIADHKTQAEGAVYIPTKPEPLLRDGKGTRATIIEKARISDEYDLWEESPTRLWGEPKGDPVLFLETMYDHKDLIFIGDRHQKGILGETIRPAKDWITFFQDGGQAGPFVIVNPLTGTPAPTKNGDGSTLRGDGNVSTFRYCMVEFDDLSREDQIRFWCAVRLPICALIDSGGKSIHAWLSVPHLDVVKTLDQWQTNIKALLYDQLLTPLGVDGACSNAARLSRLPGHYRTEKTNWQRLLWFAGPEGRPVQ